MKIYDAKVNHLTNPLGFRMTRTVFSWKVAEAAGKDQTWAQIQAALDPDMQQVVYDSGKDEKADSLGCQAVFGLEPRTRYYWTVTVHTDADEEAVSDVQYFETSKMEEAFEARWITCDSSEKSHPVFSKNFSLKTGKEVSGARLYICGLGLYHAYLNGQKIGDEYFAPYCNDYNEWVQYQTYDVTDLMTEDGTLSILLGNGWYKGRFGHWSRSEDDHYYGDSWKLLAELRIDYTDGTSDIIGTDESWTVTRSNITFSNIYDGEKIDDTLPELPEERASYCEAPKGTLTPRMSLPVTRHEIIVPETMIETPAGEQVFDLGQEITGIFRLHVHEPAGTVIHIQTGEILQEGNFYNDNLRTAKSEYFYTSDGSETILEPYFTFFGYRYAKVEGVSNLKKEDFTGVVLHSDFDEVFSAEAGHPLVNKLIQNVRWGMKGNFLDVPTDCPQRDERMGWTGDAQVFSPTATYLADTYAFYAKFLYDMYLEQKQQDGKVSDVIPNFGNQGVACVWGDAATIIPWNLYLFYGDASILEDQYESMKSWVEYIRKVDGDNHGWRYIFHYGDWLALDHPKGGAEQTQGGTDEEFIANVYYAVSAGLVAKVSEVLGRDEDAARYQALSEEQFDIVKAEYYSATGRCCIKTQTALLLTLKYHLGDEALAVQQLKKSFEYSGNKLKTGFVGTPLLGNVLTDHGMEDMAMTLLLNEDYPGWLYEVKLGATTVWERWNSLLADGTISGTSMNSMNHYAYGSILEWFIRHVAGINVQEEVPGSRLVEVKPILNLKLGHVSASYDSPAGLYKSSWEILDPSHVSVHVEVPFGAKARIILPLAPADAYQQLGTHLENGAAVLVAGSYTVSYELTGSLKKTYTLDTPVGVLMNDTDMVNKLSQILPLQSIPSAVYGLSIPQILKQYGRSMDEKTLSYIEQILQS